MTNHKRAHALSQDYGGAGRLLSWCYLLRSTVKVDSAVDRVDSRQQVDSNSGIALSTTVNHCQPKVDSNNACALSTTVDSGRQWSTGSTGVAGSTGSTGRQREWVDSGVSKPASQTPMSQHINQLLQLCSLASDKWPLIPCTPVASPHRCRARSGTRPIVSRTSS